MHVNSATGLLDGATWIPSENYNDRPSNTRIDLLVIHGISLPSGQFGGDEVIKLFTNRLDDMTLRVSSHLFIRRHGDLIQFVPFHLRAWHAGVSSFQGRENCNDFAIGIELEGTDTLPYESIQYQQLRDVIAALRKAYPAITKDRIVGHEHIAPGRKTDPGPAFCWENI